MSDRIIKRAIITGPTGAIGTALIAELVRQGIEVIAVCRPNSGRRSVIPIHPLVQVAECDLSQLCTLSQLGLGKVDAFFHFAWACTTGSGRNDMPAQIQNITYTIDAVQAAKALGCSVFIGAGSQAEYGRVEGKLSHDTPCVPENGYGMAKLCAGAMSRVECEKLGLDHIWVRILSVYGPNDNAASMIPGVIRQLLRGEKPSLTKGEQLWDYLYAADAAKAFRLVAQKGISKSIYVLGGGSAKPLKEYILTLRDQIDPQLPLGLGDIAYGPLQVMHLEADISALTRDTGFVPEWPFETGIRNTVESIKESI